MYYLLMIATLIGWLTSTSEAYYLDTPHNESNGIYCYTCHDMPGLTPAPGDPTWSDRALANPDDTMKNFICNSCHAENPTNQILRGPTKKPHASSSTGSVIPWTTECTQCHDAHYQGQLDWSKDDFAKLYLATGVFNTAHGARTYTDLAHSTSGYDYTTIGFDPDLTYLKAQTGFEDKSKWKSKGGATTGAFNMDPTRAVDGSRGLILVPDKMNLAETFEIINVTGNVITVKGKMVRDAVNGGAFAITYGQSIKSSIMPTGGITAGDLRDVKYFAPKLISGTYGGYVDLTTGSTKPLGLCQVCHTPVSFWPKSGGPATHYPATDCDSCHNVLIGGGALNALPLANGGPDQSVATGDPVILNGSYSTDADGDLLTYAWSLTSAPGGNSAVLSGANTASPTFTPEVAGTYQVSLVVNDGTVDSVADQVIITAIEYPTPTIDFTAEPSVIERGGQSTLSWSVTGADSVTLSPGGQVNSSGSQTVSPAASTTYTITATNPGDTTTAEVTVTVQPPLPTVSVVAEPSAVMLWESTRIIWATTEADLIIWRKMANGETWGAWAPASSSGYLEEAPDVTTTYEIKVENAAGSASGLVTVTVLTEDTIGIAITSPPTNTTVSQYFTQIEGLAFDPSREFEVWVNDIRAYLDGSYFRVDNLPLHAGANTITATIYGTNGDSAQTSIVVFADIPEILQEFAILQPQDGANLSEPFILVEGQLATGMAETGVTVNGVPAQVVGDHFSVNNLPLAEGENTIRAVATAITGGTVETSVTVTVNSASQEWVKLSLNPESGVADPIANPPKPFTTTLQVTPHLNTPFLPNYNLNWEYSGSAPSSADVSVVSDNEDGTEHQLSFNQPGVYTLYYTLYTANWAQYQASIKVNVLDNGEIDTLLKAKWDNVKTAWATHDVEGGLTYFAEKSKANYREALTALVAELPQIVSEMKDMELIYVRDRYAKYRIHRLQDIDGAMVNLTYYLYFVKDQSGLWKVDQF